MYWTPKVEARGRLAESLREGAATTPLTRLKLRDLDALILHAHAAKAADQEQQVQLAAASVERSQRATEALSVAECERELRDVAPAVVADLEAAGRATEAAMLRRVSFARFRLRELQPASGAPEASAEETEVIRRVAQVERDDQMSRARGLAGYCGFLLAPGREGLVEAFAERDVPRARLEAMQATAASRVARGDNHPSAAEATQREHEAVAAQQRVWSAVRRLVRAAVKDDPALSRLYAAC